jgi:hypothetical protein
MTMGVDGIGVRRTTGCAGWAGWRLESAAPVAGPKRFPPHNGNPKGPFQSDGRPSPGSKLMPQSSPMRAPSRKKPRAIGRTNGVAAYGSRDDETSSA